MPRYGSRYYDFSTEDDRIVIRATHPKAKQVLWDWAGDYGSTKDRGASQLYGTKEVASHGDWSPWIWRLDVDGVKSLRKSLTLGLANKFRFRVSSFDARRYHELLEGVSRAAKDALANLGVPE
jgi:hypothetical protein